MHPYIKGIYKIFDANRNSSIAIPMKKYMRDKFEFFGIKSEKRRELSIAYLRNNPIADEKEIKIIVKELWTLPQREFHYFAMELLIKTKKNRTEKDAPFLEYLVTHNSWWDTVDAIASQIAGPWFLKYPDQINKVSDKWNRSENIWLQRMSILFQLKYKNALDLDLLLKYIDRLSSSKEFFVQKAIGWILREYSKTDPFFVTTYVQENHLMPLSRREAMKVIQRK